MNRFRLALTDFEALARVQSYLDDLGVDTTNFLFKAAEGRHRELQAIRTARRASVAAITEFVAWPGRAPLDWYKGFLAGIFDAEGNFSGSGCVRICNTDPTIIDWTTFACRRLGLPFVVDNTREGMWNVRIRGGLEQQLRFFHLTDPAITRKRSIQGRAVKSQSRLRVTSIEPLGMELPLYDITTGTGDFIGDGVIHHNCFARPTHEYLEFNAGRDFEKEIVVKVNVPEVLRKELARPSWKREHVAMGTNTDPYQWVEGRYKLMRGIWAALRDAANPCSVLTKSPLLLRDLDLMLEVAERTEISACLSVPTLDEKAWRASEPHTPHPRARLEAVAKLNAAGIPTGVLIAPLLPGINDAPEQVEKIIALATEAGAVSIGGQTLFLHGAVRDIYFDWLRSYRPDLVPRYERLYARGGRVPMRERRAIERAAGLPAARLTQSSRAPDPPRRHAAARPAAGAAEGGAPGVAVLSSSSCARVRLGTRGPPSRTSAWRRSTPTRSLSGSQHPCGRVGRPAPGRRDPGRDRAAGPRSSGRAEAGPGRRELCRPAPADRRGRARYAGVRVLEAAEDGLGQQGHRDREDDEHRQRGGHGRVGGHPRRLAAAMRERRRQPVLDGQLGRRAHQAAAVAELLGGADPMAPATRHLAGLAAAHQRVARKPARPLLPIGEQLARLLELVGRGAGRPQRGGQLGEAVEQRLGSGPRRALGANRRHRGQG